MALCSITQLKCGNVNCVGVEPSRILFLFQSNQSYIWTTITTMLHAVLWSVDVESSAAAQQHNSGNQLGTICIKAVVNTTTISASAAWEQWLPTKDWILLNIVMSGWWGGVQRPGAAAGGGRAVQPAGLRHLGGEQGYNTRAVNEPSRSFTTIKNLLRHYANLAPNNGQ